MLLKVDDTMATSPIVLLTIETEINLAQLKATWSQHQIACLLSNASSQPFAGQSMKW